jgi:hypothetical protein
VKSYIAVLGLVREPEVEQLAMQPVLQLVIQV